MHNNIYNIHDKDRINLLIKILNEFKLLQSLRRKCYVGEKFSLTLSSISNLKQLSDDEQVIHDIIANNLLKSERLCPDSSKIMINAMHYLLESNENIDLKQTINHIISQSYRPTFYELKEYFSQHADGKFLKLIIDAINLAGIEGRIFTDISSNDTLSAELINGYTFKVENPLNLNIKCKSVKTLVVDGIIENISEIHHILEKSSETKNPILIVSRGFGNDVLNTIGVNNARETLCVIPVSSPIDIDSANILNDISVSCLADPTTANKGQLISSVNYDLLTTVQEVRCSPGLLTIVNDNALQASNHQITRILKSRTEAAHDILVKSFDERLRSMSPLQVVIKLPSGPKYNEMIEQIDIILRITRSVMQRGLFSSQNSNKFLQKIITGKFPTDAVIHGILYSVSTLELIKNIGAVIV
jgi:hypothetical protein